MLDTIFKLAHRRTNPFPSSIAGDRCSTVPFSIDVLYRSIALLRFVDRVDENVETRWERHEAHRHSHRPQDDDFNARRRA